MAKRFALAFVLVAALLAGCAGADSSAPQDSVEDVSPQPTSGSTTTADCGELADELIAQLQVIVDELSEARLEDLGRDDLLPAGTQQQLDELEGRVEDANCDDEIDRLLRERANRIQGEGVIAEAVREGLSENGDLPF
jgi:TolA-binding protein